MQEYKNDKLTGSVIGDDLESVLGQLNKNVNNGITDSATIAMLKPGETVNIKGLHFKILTVNNNKKELKLRLL